MENVFLGKSGLTSTEANYYANIAQEKIASLKASLASMKFYEEYIASIGSQEKQLMSLGQTSVAYIKDDLTEIAEMNSFCAWVREAIKYKEALIKLIESKTCEINLECPEYPETPKPVVEADVLDSWSMEKRMTYLELEAFAATFGKSIHPDGYYHEARKEAHNVATKPIIKEGSGRETVLYYRKLTIDQETIDATFLDLQKTYQSYEKQLNQLKAELKSSVNKLNKQNNEKYQQDLIQYRNDYEKYKTQVSELSSKFEQEKLAESEKIAQLKIVLPDELKEIFEKIKA